MEGYYAEDQVCVPSNPPLCFLQTIFAANLQPFMLELNGGALMNGNDWFDGIVGLGWSDPPNGKNFLKTLSANSNGAIKAQWSFFTSYKFK